MKSWLFVFAVFVWFAPGFAKAGVLGDSIGIEKKGAKTFIVHKVDPKETLYSIARKYQVGVHEIKAANEGLTSELKAGQTLLIPYKGVPSGGKQTTGAAGKHTVQSKETLYSISRKYHVSVDDLKKANPGVGGLEVGEVLIIPGKGGNAPKTETVAEKKQGEKKALPATHTVEPKETYYSIARKYSISVDELQKNNPDVKELQVGEVLNIAKPAAGAKTEPVTATKNPAQTESKPQPVTGAGETKPGSGAVAAENKPVDPKPGSSAVKKEEKQYVPVKEPKPVLGGPENNVPTFSNLKKDGYTKISETGMAELYDDNSGFHYALHKSAPVGTIIYVVNEENGQKVYVRVMGKLIDAAPGVIMKVSPKAFEKLSGKSTSKIKISSTYIP